MCIRSRLAWFEDYRQILINARMIQERIQTALIMENGADWDEMLKLQMLEIVLGARHVQSSITPKHSAYGDEWEALFIGHCGTNDRINGKLQSVDQRYWVINNDPTVIPPQHRIGNRSPDQRPPAISDADNSTRIPIRLNIEAFMYGKELIQSQYLGETIYDTIDPQSLKLPIGKPARVQGGFQSTADGRSIAGDGGRRSESRRYEGSTRQLMRKLSDQM